MLYYVIATVCVLVCLLLLLCVLLQQGRGGDMASAFGGGGSQTAFGARQGATVLSKATTVLGALFLVGSLALGIIGQRGTGSVVSGVKAPPRPAAPSAPANPTTKPSRDHDAGLEQRRRGARNHDARSGRDAAPATVTRSAATPAPVARRAGEACTRRPSRPRQQKPSLATAARSRDLRAPRAVAEGFGSAGRPALACRFAQRVAAGSFTTLATAPRVHGLADARERLEVEFVTANLHEHERSVGVESGGGHGSALDIAAPQFRGAAAREVGDAFLRVKAFVEVFVSRRTPR